MDDTTMTPAAPVMPAAPSPTLAVRIGAGAQKAAYWILRRATERSTYSGLAVIAIILGKRELGGQISQIGDAIALAIGGGLVAAPTGAARTE